MSNAQSWAETFAPIQSHYRNAVLQDTWGHLAPQKNRSYKLSILFMVSEYGNTGNTLIDTKLADDLKDSPWLYDAINEEINKHELKDSGVYRIDGTFRNFRFYGKPKKVYTL